MLALLALAAAATATFEVVGDTFQLDGQAFRVAGGALHFWRIHPDLWEDRMLRMRAMGLNVLETYLPWNLHEKAPGEFDFSGQLDVVRFVKLAESLGFLVVVRPGGYICAEFEFGGLPAWLLKDPSMRVRSRNPEYLAAQDRYYEAVMARLVPLQYNSGGGPIIMFQIENEYGYYGNDVEYMEHLYNKFRALGVVSVIITSDGAYPRMLAGSMLPGKTLATVNFDSNPVEGYEVLREAQPEGPFMVTELWVGWFSFWGYPHSTRDWRKNVEVLEQVLQLNGSFILFMAHGGTNFGFLSGGNYNGPTDGPYFVTTSYDYDAPISEAGDCGEKFEQLRDLIARYVDGVPAVPTPAPRPKAAYGTVTLTGSSLLFESLALLDPSPVVYPHTLGMEQLDQSFGYVLYESPISFPGETVVEVRGMHDRAHVFLDRELVAPPLFEPNPLVTLTVPDDNSAHTLSILVENLGRHNFGTRQDESRKGILEGVVVGTQGQFDWTHHRLSLEGSAVARLPFSRDANSNITQPAFFRGVLTVVGTPLDTFVRLPGWSKGVVYVNSFNLGRYWPVRGPQQTLFVPGPLLQEGANEVIIFEVDAVAPAGARVVEFVAEHDLVGDLQ